MTYKKSFLGDGAQLSHSCSHAGHTDC